MHIPSLLGPYDTIFPGRAHAQLQQRQTSADDVSSICPGCRQLLRGRGADLEAISGDTRQVSFSGSIPFPERALTHCNSIESRYPSDVLWVWHRVSLKRILCSSCN
jgi:hypothetical protein